MSVHYKFKSTLNFDTITFDGLHISVGDLKREIVQQKRLGKVIDFDLQITNAQTKEEYKDDGYLIPKNTTLIIARIPIAHQTKKGWEQPQAENPFASAPSSKQDNFNIDLSKMQGSEEDKIQAMMMQSTADYDPKTYHRIKGQSQVGEVPSSYRCNKCKKGGHWIKNCPFISGKDQFEAKRTTGIPRSFRDKPEMSTEKGTPFLPAEEKQEIPDDLVCGICRDLFVDAVMIPCCGSSFCDDCVRSALLESEESECPDCKEKNCSPGSLIPNRFLRNSVNVFKNETGYKIAPFKSTNQPNTKPEKSKEEEAPPVEEKLIEQEKTEEVEQPEPTDCKQQKEEEETELNTNTEPEKVVEPTPKDKDKSDSDYEDNITIKMPLKKLNDNAFGNSNDEKVSPSNLHRETSNSSSQRRHHDHHDQHTSERDKHRPTTKTEGYKSQNERSLLPTPISVHHNYPNHMMNEQMDKSLLNADMGNHSHRVNAYKPPYMQMPRGPPMHMMGHHMPSYNNGYNNMAPRPPMGYGPYQNQPVHQMRTSYIPTGNVNINSPQLFQSSNLASIYQGVAAKVGTGLIDDPLEAFNRIMKEKEKKKIERRRSPDRHRSRTPDRQRHRFKSPLYDRDISRDTNSKERRPRSRDRDRKREFSYERRQGRPTRHSPKGSNSPSDKRKRSVHRRSTSPKLGYKHSFKEKPFNKPYVSKMDTLEPPPPGFESLQIGSLMMESEPPISNKFTCPVTPTEFKIEHAKKVDDEVMPRKRQRSWSKNEDIQDGDNCYRSLTPPSKSKAVKVSKGKVDDTCKHSPRTPERKDADPEDRVNPSHKRQRHLNTQKSINEKEAYENNSPEHLETSNHTGKENEIKIDLQLKERKKKKKVKSERKKNKKDKKEKREKTKKSSSPNVSISQERPSNVDASQSEASFSNNTTNIICEPICKMISIKDNDFCGEEGESDPNKISELHKPTKKTSENIAPGLFQRFDSVLDIGSYDIDFDEGMSSSRNSKRNDADALHMSKWELDDNNLNSNLGDPSKKLALNEEHESNAITSDVIRKAENAIFAKAINAIRPVEFKVTIDSKSNSKDRAIAIRNDNRDRSPSPKCNINKSVKDRLGSKVVREKMRSPNRSKDKRRESVGRNIKDDKYKDMSDNYRSRKRAKTSKERLTTAERERLHESKEGPRNRRSLSQEHDHEVKSQRDRNRDSSFTDKYKSQNRDKSGTRTNKYEKSTHQGPAIDQNACKNLKTGDSRIISSVASRPCRPDNPFRKFDDSGMSNPSISKFDKSSKRASSQSGSNTDDEQDKKKRRDKKFKKHAKCSSTESLRSEKRRDLKSKRKGKLVKKKKKSKK